MLFGQGSISDQGGARLLLATQSATAIETKLAGGTLAVTGNPVHDFQAYAPGAAAVTLNGVTVAEDAGKLRDALGVMPPPGDAGTPDAGTPDAGTPDAGAVDAGTPDAGVPDAGAPDAGADAGDAGDLCGNCEPSPDGGANPGLDAGSNPDAGPTLPDAGSTAPPDGGVTDPRLPDLQPGGCSHSGKTLGWLAAVAAVALRARRRRTGT